MADETKIQWHPAFCSAMELTLLNNAESLDYDSEYNLSRKPLQVDLLVIHKEDPIMCNALKELMRPEIEAEFKEKEITGAINLARDMNMTDQQIEEYLERKFNITREEAEKYLEPVSA